MTKSVLNKQPDGNTTQITYQVSFNILFFIAGLISATLVGVPHNISQTLFFGFFAGPIFTLSVLCCYWIKKRVFNAITCLVYFLVMCFTYFALYFGTILCGSGGMLAGIPAGALGAYAVFAFTNYFLLPVGFNKTGVFF